MFIFFKQDFTLSKFFFQTDFLTHLSILKLVICRQHMTQDPNICPIFQLYLNVNQFILPKKWKLDPS